MNTPPMGEDLKDRGRLPTKGEDLPVFVRWMEFLQWLLPTTEKFPKRVRFTFATRIDNLALDVVEDLVEARYSRRKEERLKAINLKVERLRVLLRLCHELALLPYHLRREFFQPSHTLG